MKALFAYDNNLCMWVLLCADFSGAGLTPAPEMFKKRLSDYGREVIPKVVEAELTYLEYDEEKGRRMCTLKEPLPEMPDLHQSIKANKEKLRAWLSNNRHGRPAMRKG